MKKIIICSILLITASAGLGQQTKPSPALTKADYLKKSKNQKIAAFTTLGTGVVLLTTGFIALDNTVSKGEKESLLILSGLLITSVSIPLFISSQINKKKGMVVSFKNQVLPQVNNSSFIYKPVPSIAFKINL